MSYLEDFQAQINSRDFSKFLQLWEEYSHSDSVDAEEFMHLLQALKASDFAKLFGQLIETALPLWKTIQNENDSYEVLKLLIDLQITNTPLLADAALEAVQKRYSQQPEYSDRLRLIGLRNRDQFQGSLANYDLLAHMAQGKFVYHTGGWGTGEIIEVSPVREQLAVEFENVAGKKHITYLNAFKTLIPLPDDNFFARRFADPDLLEKEAKEDPIAVVKLLLRDLGPKTAIEIKDELCELVIPEVEWVKWWQTARTKLKKNTMIETPETLKGVFRLRKKEVTHEERLQKEISGVTDLNAMIHTTYNFVRDLPANLKKSDVQDSLKEKLLGLLKNPELTNTQELQILILLEMYFSHPIKERPLKEFITHLTDIEACVNAIEIIAIKKKALTLLREFHSEWTRLFVYFLFHIQQSTLRDYLIKELNQGEAKPFLVKELTNLLNDPTKNPEFFVWFFHKIVTKGNEDLPFSDKEGVCLFFEAFFILFSAIEIKIEYRDLSKKMYTIMSGNRYLVVRTIIEGTSIEFIKEFLLLVSKCQSLSDHDTKILRSLAEVVHPSLAATKSRKGTHVDANTIWTTEAGYLRTQDKAKKLGTVDIIENAKEIEAARALGDLRENSEYKFALEKRSRMQSDLKMLSDQLKQARLITREDISLVEVGIGNVVELEDSKGKAITYTILGPWDADLEANILASQSKFALAMVGYKVGESFQFRDEEYKVKNIKSYLD